MQSLSPTSSSTSWSMPSALDFPCSLVVLQGTPGDGMANTIDVLPPVVPPIIATAVTTSTNNGTMHEEENIIMLESSVKTDVEDPPATRRRRLDAPTSTTTTTATTTAAVIAAVAATASALDIGTSSTVEEDDDDDDDDAANTTIITNNSDYVVIPNGGGGTGGEVESSRLQQQQPELEAADDDDSAEWRAAWQAACVQAQQRHRQEWWEATTSIRKSSPATNDLWWANEHGQLHVYPLDVASSTSSWDDLPSAQPISSLAPGTRVVASEAITVPLAAQPSVLPSSSNSSSGAILQIMRIHTPCKGYIVYAIDGYAYLRSCEEEEAPETSDAVLAAAQDHWYWRVVWTAGAVIREGLELNTPNLGVIPYGALVQVTRKQENPQGLPRLLVEYQPRWSARNNSNNKMIRGWCSETLNPLSGERGHILRPLPLLGPVQYRVLLAEGAVVRNHTELSSPIVTTLPQHALVTVTQRRFSESPSQNCIARLRIYDGWASAKLNKPPPLDLLVAERVQLLDVADIGKFHVQQLQRVHQQQQQHQHQSQPHQQRLEETGSISSAQSRASGNGSCIGHNNTSSADSGSGPSASAAATAGGSNGNINSEPSCSICCNAPLTATLVHGETGHICCCLQCARLLRAQGHPCPVCRLPIDLVVQHFTA